MPIVVKDNGADKLLRNLQQGSAGRGVLDVGVLGKKAAAASKSSARTFNEEGTARGLAAGRGVGFIKSRPSRPLSVGEIAEIHELGLGQVPRPFIRGYIDNNRAEIQKKLEAELARMIRTAGTRKQAMERFGVWLEGRIKKWMVNLNNGLEPNDPETIINKGSAVPLIDTGQLRAAVSHRVFKS